MSEYHLTTTKWKDRDALIAGLKNAGYKESDIEIHDQAVQLFDYHGQATHYLDRSGDKANVIIRRHRIGYGSANDIGFKLNPTTGTYDAIISEFDQGENHWGPGSNRMKATKQGYTEAVHIKAGVKAGFKYLGKTMVNGKPQLKFMDLRSI
jgi:hypothetical protein